MIQGLIAAIVFVFAMFLGWVAAHNVVIRECKQLGGFYVGKTVYECKVKGETK
jgi:hypothetical protein